MTVQAAQMAAEGRRAAPAPFVICPSSRCCCGSLGGSSKRAQSAAASFNPAHRLIEQTTSSTIRFGIKDRTEAYKDAHQLYAALNLPDPDRIGDRYPHQVSGGQLQRVMTAMAMSPRPDLIIFDEPTTALDVTTQIEVLEATEAFFRRQLNLPAD